MKKLLWQKTMTKTDAQRQKGNPTGDLRLTRAKYKINGKDIDQTEYFRDQVFGNLEWSCINQDTGKEVCESNFEIFFDNEKYGERILQISHKPLGEAGQSNYTTGIRWGPWLSHLLIHEIDCTGKVVSLFSDNNYIIEIS
jgi:hypothetical protein